MRIRMTVVSTLLLTVVSCDSPDPHERLLGAKPADSALVKLPSTGAPFFDGGIVTCSAQSAKNGVTIVNPGETPLHLIGNSPPLSPDQPAIVLVHGWSAAIGYPSDYCDAQVDGGYPGENYFQVLIAKLRTRYPTVPILVFDYPPYISWRGTAPSLAKQLTDLSAQVSGFVVIAHSMGGMVSDSAIAALSEPTRRSILGLITLGTPHEGTALGKFAATFPQSIFFNACQTYISGLRGICSAGTASLSGVAPASTVLAANIPLYAHAGYGPAQFGYQTTHHANLFNQQVVYPAGLLKLQTLPSTVPGGNFPSDGVVPWSSAMVNSQAGNPNLHQYYWPYWDHSDLAATSLPGDGSVFLQVALNIDEILSKSVQLRFVTAPPSAGSPNVPLAPFTVGVFDAFGHLMPAASTSIEVWIRTATGAGYTAINGTARPVAGGTATFPAVTIAAPGTFAIEAAGKDPRLQHVSSPITIGSITPPPPPPGEGNWAQVANGSNHVCALSRGGVAYCWGDDFFGQLGDGLGVGQPRSVATPTLVSTAQTFTSIVAGGGTPLTRGSHTCALTASNDAYCWGANEAGQVGYGLANTTVPSPMPVTGGHKFKQLTAGRQHTCGLTTAGDAYCWGDAFGVGAITDNPTLNPAPSAIGTKFQSLSAGGSYTCGLAVSGDVWCWGYGPGVVISNPDPVIVAPASLGFTSITTGSWDAVYGVLGVFMCGRTAAGAVLCIGDDYFGEMGNNTRSPAFQTTFMPVSSTRQFSVVSAGWTHACALSGTSAYCWGSASFVGNGATTDQLVPGLVSGGSSGGALAFASISAGRNSTCGVTLSHEIWCWGDDNYGQIGQGAPGPFVSTPVKVPFKPSH